MTAALEVVLVLDAVFAFLGRDYAVVLRLVSPQFQHRADVLWGKPCVWDAVTAQRVQASNRAQGAVDPACLYHCTATWIRDIFPVRGPSLNQRSTLQLHVELDAERVAARRERRRTGA
jgi:hypothetical protein